MFVDTAKKTILSELYEFHNNIFNIKDAPMSVKKISDTTKLDETLVKSYCNELETDKLVKSITLPRTLFYKITARGVKYIEGEKH